MKTLPSAVAYPHCGWVFDPAPHSGKPQTAVAILSAVVAGASKGGRRIDNPPQIANLPHEYARHRLRNSSRRAKNVMDSSTTTFSGTRGMLSHIRGLHATIWDFR